MFTFKYDGEAVNRVGVNTTEDNVVDNVVVHAKEDMAVVDDYVFRRGTSSTDKESL